MRQPLFFFFFFFWTWAWAIILNLKMAVVPYFGIDITAGLPFILTNQTQTHYLDSHFVSEHKVLMNQ